VANCRYFPVVVASREPSLPLASLINATIREAVQRDEQHQRTLNIIRDSKSLVTKTPWLRRTRWEEMFSGQDMGVLNQLTHSPNLYSFHKFTCIYGVKPATTGSRKIIAKVIWRDFKN
jgi:hypothetical protein